MGTALARLDLPIRRADHPHGRGDGRAPCGRESLTAGSPPRAWGRPYGRQLTRRLTRITPTGVGTAGWWWRAGRSGTDHPHGRGDGGETDRLNDHRHGSPPRAWGRPRVPKCAATRLRITPTGVGTAHGAGTPNRSRPDHPHGRGDGSNHPTSTRVMAGSPPRAWGRPDRRFSDHHDWRITPTGVGTARSSPDPRSLTTDHPHGRGDGDIKMEKSGRIIGSPPRAWGRRHEASGDARVVRITPTGVGTARAPRTGRACSPDHPHGRGDGPRTW